MKDQIEYKGYKITREDDRNWSVTIAAMMTAKRDWQDKDGNITIQKGEQYEGERLVGYAHDIGQALNVLVRDLAGRGCSTIQDLSNQLRELKSNLSRLYEVNV